MERGNVLIIGNSGVGKSTLINAVLGENKAVTGYGTTGVTLGLDIFESEEVPFRLVDTIGFEPTLFNEYKATRAIKRWSKEAAKEGKEDNKIDMIWLCVDGTSRKLFIKTINSLFKATRMWKSVPIIAVITKSYGEADRDENIKMVSMAFNEQKKAREPIAIIPVVASPYEINETIIVPPQGITELIEITNEKMPEAIKAADKDLYEFKLKRRRGLSHSIVGLSTAAGVTIGAVPIPFADAAILAPLEFGLIRALSRIYEINRNEKSKALFSRIVEVGTVGQVAKATISGLKAILGINLATSVINAIVAGAFVAAIGQGAIYAFENIYTGEKSVEDLDWITRVIENQLSNQFLEKVTVAIEKIQENGDMKNMSKLISSLITSIFLQEEPEVK